MQRWVGFEKVRTNGGWVEDAWIAIGDDGRVAESVSGAGRTVSDFVARMKRERGEVALERVDAEWIGGIAVPGIPNVHSHAFQWTFAGMSERRTATRDSFWTWRDQMYRVVQTLQPDSLFDDAVRLYRLMLRSGYTTVGEFHYVHHRPDGTPYDCPERLADVLIRAATEAGIRICMLPVVYQRGGFDDRPLVDAQRRFALSGSQAVEMLDALRTAWGDHPLVEFGLALHSLRAVPPDSIEATVQRFEAMFPDAPIHIHVAEQVGEVDQCVAVHGCRPVELLLDSASVDSRWCLVHATHMTDSEAERLAATGAVAGVCPTTEANLGDGVFGAARWRDLGGRWAIGSDSHVAVDPFSELRLLEYGQRLSRLERAVLCDDGRSCGAWLFDQVVAGGRRVTGGADGAQTDAATIAGLHVGGLADLVVLDPASAALQGVPAERILDRAVFCQWGSIVRRTMVGGRWVDEDRRSSPSTLGYRHETDRHETDIR